MFASAHSDGFVCLAASVAVVKSLSAQLAACGCAIARDSYC